MPEGTIQDSRNPTSNQFGYLEIEESDHPGHQGQANSKDPGNSKQLIDKGITPGVNPWNRFVMFIYDPDLEGVEAGGAQFIRGNRVEYEMVHIIAPLEGRNVKIWVAKVTKKL